MFVSCAAGAGVADLSSQQAALEVDRAPLPSVTMVFASVEGGRALLRRRQDVGRLVHHMIGRIMQVFNIVCKTGASTLRLCIVCPCLLQFVVG
jgi:hypothetical protein